MAKLFGKRKPGDAVGAAGGDAVVGDTPEKPARFGWDKLETDTLQIYPEIAELRYAALEGDWAYVADFIDRCEHETDRSWVTNYLIDIDGVETMLTKALADDPGSLLASALLGGRVIRQGWDIRGSSYAKHVKADAWEAFFEHMRRAEAILLDVLARDPANLEAGRFRLWSGKGNQVGLSEITRRYEQLAAHHPHSFSAQSSMLQSLCPKWGGNWPDAHQFARRCAKAAPRGAVNGALVADVHIEHWLSLDDEKKAQKAYFKHPEVRAELLQFAGYSVLHEDYQGHLGWTGVHGSFAFAFAKAEEWKLAYEQFTRLDGCMGDHPWDYTTSPDYTYKDLRLKAERGLLGL